ncbi:NAD(P)-binding protein [Aaosphaeria arxii CBS 175.79]|uniref:NAD(P)-binding protein n=1 Tax=Aaosphaeria arxii CBS 175.79 TaxID=1450172 RepID=A0A6A5Y5A0_9PLEO|nr:NAD(P)-binding protein [Aaosphaeria arxii CBS 175.79]KAF2019960.1 NAD(P)-binding protein [Aaosphaeria arxii CBS 175.79]
MADYRPQAPQVQQQDLKGKVALITGATKGIGRAIAIDLATRGASILGTYTSSQSAHNFDTLSHTITSIYNSTSSSPTPTTPLLKGIPADITSLTSIDTVLDALQTFPTPKLDTLVLNASYNVHPPLGTATPDDISKTLIANLHWPTQLVETLTRDNLFNPNARIVVISSDRLRLPRPGFSLYAVSKAGLEALVRTWAIELPLKFPGTTANAVSVGMTDTPLFRSYPRERQQAVIDEWMAKVKVVEGGRMGFPEDVADVVGWLVSEKSRWQTGSVVAANGGSVFVGGSN